MLANKRIRWEFSSFKCKWDCISICANFYLFLFISMCFFLLLFGKHDDIVKAMQVRSWICCSQMESSWWSCLFRDLCQILSFSRRLLLWYNAWKLCKNRLKIVHGNIILSEGHFWLNGFVEMRQYVPLPSIASVITRCWPTKFPGFLWNPRRRYQRRSLATF